MLSDLLEKYGGGTRLCLFFKKKSVSVFANGNGGKLIFGVADDDTITGLGYSNCRQLRNYHSGNQQRTGDSLLLCE